MNDVTLDKSWCYDIRLSRLLTIISGSQNGYRQTNDAFMAALGLTYTDKKLFESIKDTLKDIMRDHMDWRKTFGGQTKETLELVELKVSIRTSLKHV